MTYNNAKKKRSEIRSQLRNANRELAELEVNRDELLQEFEASYEALTDARAQHKVGDGTGKEVQEAEKRNSGLKEKVEQVKADLDVQEKAVSLLESKRDEIETKFRATATEHWRGVADQHLSKIGSLMEDLQAEIDRLNSHRKELQTDGFQNPERQLFRGVSLYSEPMISKKRMAGIASKDYIRVHHLTETEKG